MRTCEFVGVPDAVPGQRPFPCAHNRSPSWCKARQTLGLPVTLEEIEEESEMRKRWKEKGGGQCQQDQS